MLQLRVLYSSWQYRVLNVMSLLWRRVMRLSSQLPVHVHCTVPSGVQWAKLPAHPHAASYAR